jgi:hypothetical protein
MVDIVGVTASEIKNQALFALGFVDEIDFTSLTDETVKKVNRIYDTCLVKALTNHRWRFAIKRDNLTASKATATEDWKFKYLYTLPTDMLSYNASYTDEDYSCVIHEFETNQTYLNCDETKVYLMYTALVAETAFPQYFINYFQYQLALDLCFNLTGDTDLMKILAEQTMNASIRAKNIDSRQNPARTIKASPYTQVRR